MSVKPGKILSGEDLLQSHITNDMRLPKIGEKKFKPTGSWLEKKQIQTALDENKQLLEEERVEKFGALAQAVWYNNKKLAEVTKKVGKYFHTMGFEKDGKLFVYPEEALYLLEMNCLQLNYDGVPLSIQQAYSLLLTPWNCSLKEYRTYSHLVKQGYRLLRYTKTGMPTNYEHRIRLDQHVPQKREFPEMDEVTVEPVPSNISASSNPSVRDDSSPVECTAIDRIEKSDVPVKSEKDSVEVSESMKDFAKSIADMGKSLIKNEEGGGSKGLGLDSLRQKIHDMLEDHFQGHISPEAMDTVSRSASKAILVHVEDVNSEKSCVTPNLRVEERYDVETDEAVEKRSSEDSEETAEKQEDEKSEEAADKRRDEESAEVPQNKDGSETEEAAEKREDEKLKEAAGKKGDEKLKEASQKKDSSGTKEAADVRRDEESEETSQNKDGSETEEAAEKREDEKSEEAADKRRDESEEAPQNKDGSETEEAAEKREDEKSEEAADKRRDESEEAPQNKDGSETEEAAEKREDEKSKAAAGKKDDEKLKEASQKKDSSGTKEAADVRRNEESEEASQNKDGSETGDAVGKRGSEESGKTSENVSEFEMETKEFNSPKEARDGGVSCTDVSKNQSESKTSDIECGSSKGPSDVEYSTETFFKSDDQRKEPSERHFNGNELSSDEMTDFEESTELSEIPVEGYSSQETTSEKSRSGPKDGNTYFSESDSSEEETMSEILEYEVFDWDKIANEEDMQVDDDVVEIEDPNTWKNVKAEKSDQDKERDHSQKWSFRDSNGWRSFKESQSNSTSTEGSKLEDQGEVDIIAVRNSKDIDIELIDISEDSCAKQTQEPVASQSKEEIEIVDLDESDSDSSEASEDHDIKQEKSPKQRPKLVSAFERARDARRKFIMDSFPNMINRNLYTIDIPPRHLLPPNVNPVNSQYTVSRREMYAERPHRPFNHSRRPVHIPRFNNYYNNNPRPYYPRQPFRPPLNHMQGAPMRQINPAAMQAFQMITSIVLPMFGINNMGPRFMGQPQWNHGPPWQQPHRNWQNHQPWRFQQRTHHWNHNRFNIRPWHGRNAEREQQDVLDRPKRPALLPNSDLPTAGRVSPWNDDSSNQELRRPKRPFVVDHSVRDIEEEQPWKKVKRMNEDESNSDSESELTITPINPPPKSSGLQPVLKLDQCGSSSEIMACLDVIKTAEPRKLNVPVQNRQLKISYDLFLPDIPFKKSSPPTPNFRLCVMSVEEQMPNPGEISLLQDNIHDGVPLMFAVVDPDSISFFQYSAITLPKHTFSS